MNKVTITKKICFIYFIIKLTTKKKSYFCFKNLRAKIKQKMINLTDTNEQVNRLIDQFDSMLKVTQYILYDDDTATQLFHLSPKDMKQIDYFVAELDFIQDDLIEINEQIKQYKNSYRNYCKSLLKLCDDKDQLVEMFLDYYQEYIEVSNDSDDDEHSDNKKDKKRKKKLSATSKSTAYAYAVPVQNRFGILSKTY